MRPGGLRGDRGHDPLGEILDVDEAPRLQAIAGDRQRLACQRLVDEDRQDRRRPGARSVRDPEAQDRRPHAVQLAVRAAVHLAGELRRGVQVRGQAELGVLVDLGRADVGVDPDRGRVDDAGAGRAGGFEHVERAARVERLRAGRVLRDEADVGGGSEVEDDVAALGSGAQADRIEQIADDVLAVAARCRARIEHVEHAHGVPLRQQAVDDV